MYPSQRHPLFQFSAEFVREPGEVFEGLSTWRPRRETVQRVRIRFALGYYGANQPPPAPTPLPREEEHRVWLRYKKLNRGSDREVLVRQYLCFAFGLAARYKGPRLDFDEAVGVANEGLMEAMDGYDPLLGYRFTTYATFIIYRKLIEAILSTYPAKVSDHLRKKLRKIEQDPKKLAEAALHNEPKSLEEFFDRLGEYVPSDIAKLHERNEDAPFMPAEAESPADSLEQSSLSEELRAAIQRLLPLERETVLARYYRKKKESYVAIGRRLRVSKATVRNADESALRKLRSFLKGEI